MKRAMKHGLATTFFLVLLFFVAAGVPYAGDMKEMKNDKTMMNEGQTMVDKGEMMMKEGKAMVDKGEMMVKKGKMKMDNGEKMKSEGQMKMDKGMK